MVGLTLCSYILVDGGGGGGLDNGVLAHCVQCTRAPRAPLGLGVRALAFHVLGWSSLAFFPRRLHGIPFPFPFPFPFSGATGVAGCTVISRVVASDVRCAAKVDAQLLAAHALIE